MMIGMNPKAKHILDKARIVAAWGLVVYAGFLVPHFLVKVFFNEPWAELCLAILGAVYLSQLLMRTRQ